MTDRGADLKIDVSTPELRRAWDKTRLELGDAGWKIGDTDDGVLIDRAEASARHVQVTLCRKPEGAAVPADTYGVLKALDATGIEDALVGSIAPGIRVDKVLIGYNWTMVRAGDLVGIARSPARGTEGARTIRPEGGFAGCALSQLANHFKSGDPLHRSLGLAAVNAYWNRPDADYPAIKPTGGLAGIEPPGDGVIIIGGFRGAQKRLPKARIVEREPRGNDIPAETAEPFIRNAQTLVITAQALMNGSLEPLRRIARSVPCRMLVGPSAPLCPLLLELGFHQISAAVVQDADAVEAFVAESGTMIMLDPIVRSAYLGVD